MAQAGFPWHAQSLAREGAPFSEKDNPTLADTFVNGALADATNGKSVTIQVPDTKQKSNESTKRRSDSVRTGAIAKPYGRVQSEPPRAREPVKRIPVRTIPAWIQDADEDDVLEASYLLPDSPNNALIASHNHTPSAIQRALPSNGGFPLSSGARRDTPTSRWVSFARASAYPRENFNSEKVDADWLNENFTDYSKAWLEGHNEDDVEDGSDKYRAFRRKRRVWYKRLHFAIMRNPFVPLVFRIFVITFASTAMALGASIYHENNVLSRCLSQEPGFRDVYCESKVGQGSIDYDREDPSALMAIIVDAVAIVYTIYITYDEYFSKPLGLRPAAAKVRLVLLDLFFIVFQSANLSLAFNATEIDTGACQRGGTTNKDFWFDKDPIYGSQGPCLQV